MSSFQRKEWSVGSLGGKREGKVKTDNHPLAVARVGLEDQERAISREFRNEGQAKCTEERICEK